MSEETLSEEPELSRSRNERTELNEVSLRDKMESEQVHLRDEEKKEMKK